MAKIAIGKMWGKNIYQDEQTGEFYHKVKGQMVRLPQKAQDVIIGFRTGHYTDRTRKTLFITRLPRKMPQ